MKKMFIPVGLVTVLTIFLALPCHSADVAKIGVVNVQRFYMESDIGKAANAKVESEYKKLDAQLEEAGKKLKELETALERDAMVLSDEKREQREREYRIKKYDFDMMKKKHTETIRNLNREVVSDLSRKLKALANEFGQKEGFLLLLRNEFVLYCPGALDVTDKLIQFANSKHLVLEGENRQKAGSKATGHK